MIELLAENHFAAAFGMTVFLALCAAAGSLVIGTGVALLRISPVPLCRRVGAAYVNIVRNTPLVLIIIACNIVMAVNLGFNFSDNFVRNNIIWSIIGLSVYHGAYVCEALRSGVNTIGRGQVEAARAVGLSFPQTVREVIIPQAYRGAITPLGTTMIALIKNTTIATAIGVAEVSGAMKSMQEARADLAVPILLVVATGFLCLTLPVGVLTSRLSSRLAVKR
ncbi:amino acid ABC transporter permease [Mycolicibacterium sp.]|uniref:amino acid ABC transporter permease n=1 Tax=Mycolicibacterium sp. TaxID=2320850 RepID=UPI003D11219B